MVLTNIKQNLSLHIENGIVFAYGVLKNKNTLQTVEKRTVNNESPGKRESFSTLCIEDIHLEYEGGMSRKFEVSQPQVLVVGKLSDGGIRVLHIYNSPDGLWGSPIVMLENTQEHIPMFVFVSQEQVREDLSNADRKKKRLYLMESTRGQIYPHVGTLRKVKKIVVELDKYNPKAPALFIVKNKTASEQIPFSGAYREQVCNKDTSILHILATQVGCQN